MGMDQQFLSNCSSCCRFCLKTETNVVDIFETGLYDMITAATRLEPSFSDNLPRNVCIDCKRQTEEIYRFVNLVKLSESRLLHILTEKEAAQVVDVKAEAKETSWKEAEYKKEELFLIVVPKRDASDHTYPKENESTRVAKAEEDEAGDDYNYSCNHCGKPFENVVAFVLHFYKCRLDNGDQSVACSKCPICGLEADISCSSSFSIHLRTHEREGVLNVFKLYPKDEGSEKHYYKVNLNGRRCKKCQILSESEKLFIIHARESHGIVFRKGEKPQVAYVCPACSHRSIDDPDGFLEHLSAHVKGHVAAYACFIKVDVSGNLTRVKKKEMTAFLSTSEARVTLNKEGTEIECIQRFWTPEADVKATSCIKNNYSCEFCGQSLKTKAGVSRHVKQHLTSKIAAASAGAENLVCEKCGRKFLDKSDYKKHFSSHCQHFCTVCNKIFSSRKKLIGHLSFHQPLVERKGISRVCEMSGNEILKNSEFAEHKTTVHSSEQVSAWPAVKCRICNRTFSNGKWLSRHEAAHFDPSFFECNICRLPLPSLSRLERHLQVHRRNNRLDGGSTTWVCDICDLVFQSKDGLSCHQSRTGHVRNRKPLECNVCHEKFYVANKFALHVKTLHKKYKTSECSLCGKRLSTLQSLSLHTKRHFQQDGILCPECGKSFFEERNYRRHLLTHRGIRPHACDYPGCGKSFYTLFEIKRHKKYHFDTRDFPCPRCSKKFHESNHLKVHMRTHTGEKPYVCPHCRKGFATRTRCKQHIKLIHRGEGYELIQTDISKKVPVFELT